jgi:hypothetical protein
MGNIKFVNVAVLFETKKQTKSEKWGEIYISMLVLTHSEVGTGQKVIKLKV